MSPARAAPPTGAGAVESAVRPSTSPHERLARAVERARHILPTQGPITRFVHHNTLHAFQHLPFEVAVVEARRVLGGEPYLSEERYRAELARGRILERDLDRELDAHERRSGPPPDDLPPGVERRALRRLLVLHPIDEAGGQGLRWQLEDGGLARRLAPAAPPAARARILAETRAWIARLVAEGDLARAGEALTGEADPSRADACLRDAVGVPLARLARAAWRDPEALAAFALTTAARRRARPDEPTPPPRVRHRDRLLALTGEDSDALTHPILIRWISAFLDQGVAYWPMPGRERGLFRAFVDLAGQPWTLEKPFLRGFARELADLGARGATAEQVVEEVLRELNVAEAAWEEYVLATLLALPGWGDMVSALEREPWLAPGAAPPARLIDLLAVRLLIERRALQDVARRHLGPGARLDALPEPPAPSPDPERAAWRLRQVCELLGVAAHELLAFSPAQVAALEREVAAFGPLERRAVWHLAYERTHREQVLAGLAKNRGRAPTPARPAELQAVFCIDERSESLRRHLEELGGPRVETFGAAGFFGLAIRFQGLDDVRPSSLCPVAVRPEHEVLERVDPGDAALLAARRRRRRLAGAVGRGVFVGSRSLFRGAVVTLVMGLFSALPLVVRTLLPRGWTRWARRLQRGLLPRPRAELTALREGDERGPEGLPLGFGVDEAAARVARLLEDTGLARRLGALVVVVGHGASTVNNPHASAYDCGACGGRRGGPNARLFARLANDPRVREAMRARGVVVPDGTWFVGALHDTTTDELTLFDEDRAPPSHAERLAAWRALVERARARNALERCRRFESAPRGMTPEEALAHVEARSMHLAEPRPEYNHGTNAVCVVGRRALTRGLFLDRRAFLISYDPEADPDGAVLARVLAAAAPVGAGINLEYYFSTTDNEVYGCGTKLPHNVTGLLGVMNGHQSDLRTGLPYQTLDIHEPVRLLTIVEATPERLLEVTRREPLVAELVLNRWIQLVSLDPATGAMQVLERDGFVAFEPPPVDLPAVPTSAEYPAGRREHLPPALVRAGLEASC